MEAGQKAIYQEQEVEIVAYVKGWYTCRMKNGADIKARAKSLTALTEEKPAEETPAAGPIKVRCPECDHQWTVDPATEKTVNVKCSVCGAWCRIHLNPNLEGYVRGLGTTSGGSPTLDIADATADKLRGLDVTDLLDEAGEILAAIGMEFMSKSFIKAYGKDNLWGAEEITEFLTARYEKRNNGMIRMNVGNIIRAAQNRMADPE